MIWRACLLTSTNTWANGHGPRTAPMDHNAARFLRCCSIVLLEIFLSVKGEPLLLPAYACETPVCVGTLDTYPDA